MIGTTTLTFRLALPAAFPLLLCGCGSREALSGDVTAQTPASNQQTPNGNQWRDLNGVQDFVVRAGGAGEFAPFSARSSNIVGLGFTRYWNSGLPEQLMFATTDDTPAPAGAFKARVILESDQVVVLGVAGLSSGFALAYQYTVESSDVRNQTSYAMLWLDTVGNVVNGPVDLRSSCDLGGALAASGDQILVACSSYATQAGITTRLIRCSSGSCSPCDPPSNETFLFPPTVVTADSGWDVLGYSYNSTDNYIAHWRVSQQCDHAETTPIQASIFERQGVAYQTEMGPVIAAVNVNGLLWLATVTELAAYDQNGSIAQGPFALNNDSYGLGDVLHLTVDDTSLWVVDESILSMTAMGTNYRTHVYRVNRSDPTQVTSINLTTGTIPATTLVTLGDQTNLIWTEGSGLLQETADAVASGTRPNRALFGNLSRADAGAIRTNGSTSAILVAEPTPQLRLDYAVGFWQVEHASGTVSPPVARVPRDAYAYEMSFDSSMAAATAWSSSGTNSTWQVNLLTVDGGVQPIDVTSLPSPDVEFAYTDAAGVHVVQDGADYNSLTEYTVTNGILGAAQPLESGYFFSGVRPCTPGYVGWFYNTKLSNDPVAVARMQVGSDLQILLNLNRDGNGMDDVIDLACNASQIGLWVVNSTSGVETHRLRVSDAAGNLVSTTDVTGTSCVAHTSDNDRLYWVMDDPTDTHAFSLIAFSQDGSVQRQRLELPPQVTKLKFVNPWSPDGCVGNALEVTSDRIRLAYSDVYGNLRLGVWPRQ